jgi:ATPase family AAA domain-containing protein 2
MLDSLAPTDPILLFGVVNGSLDEVPRDIRDWFGYSRETRVFLCPSTPAERSAFFHDVLAEVSRPPNEFPDAIKRRKRVLEKLPIAPPLPPRQPTAVEIASQLEKDRQTIVTLTVRLGPILSDLKKRYRRVTRSIEARVSSHR